MSNKKILLTLLALYSSLISACEPEEQMERELTVCSLSGTKVSCPLGSMVLPTGGNFNGHELLEANPTRNKDNIYEFFAKIADKFGFKYHHPMEFKFVSRGELEFSCINSRIFSVRTSERGGILLEISGLGAFQLRDYPETGWPVKFLPLFRFEGKPNRFLPSFLSRKTIPYDSALKIVEDIGQGVSLDEYEAIVRKHTADYNPRPYSAFPAILRMSDCDEDIGSRFAETPDVYGSIWNTGPSIYDAINTLLDELSTKVCTRGLGDCLLFHTAPEHSSKFKICKKPSWQESEMDFFKKFVLRNYFPESLMFCNDDDIERARLKQTLAEKISIELTELPKSRRLVKVFLSAEEVIVNIGCGFLTLRIDPDCYTNIRHDTYAMTANDRTYRLNTRTFTDTPIFNDKISLREGYDSGELLRSVEEGEKRDRTFRILEFIKPHIATKQLPFVTFTVEPMTI